MKVETFRIIGWEEPETGLVIDENNEWVLVKFIPVDYQIDGYKIYKKAFIEQRSHSARESAIEKVLKLKGVQQDTPTGFKFDSTLNLLKWSEQNYGLFEFQDSSESEVFYGKISEVQDGPLTIDMIKTDGSVEGRYEFDFEVDEIRAVTFESDYFTSMRLLWEDKVKNKIPEQSI